MSSQDYSAGRVSGARAGLKRMNFGMGPMDFGIEFECERT